MKLATWNINSIRARQAKLAAWLGVVSPDVVCLQETKVEEADFPTDWLAHLGYHVAHVGQKSYNGVAIASKTPLRDIARGFADGEPDDEARVIAATVDLTPPTLVRSAMHPGGPSKSLTTLGSPRRPLEVPEGGRGTRDGAGIFDTLRVVNVYVPNGQELSSDKYAYKLAWFRRLRRYLDRTANPSTPLVLCGDMNVALDDRDVWSPAQWAGKIHCSLEERAALAEITAFGLVDLFRMHHPDGGTYSWWDYRGVSFFKNQGLRIDYIFATDPAAKMCTGCAIDRDARKGQDASDHAPVIASIGA